MYQEPTIYNLAMAVANNEYSQAIPQDTKKLLIRSRGINDLKLAYSSGATNYITIPAGSAKTIDAIYLENLTLYLKSSGNNDVAEIEIFK